MKNIHGSQFGHPNHHTGNQQAPHRTASRMEGAVKNRGNKPTKK